MPHPNGPPAGLPRTAMILAAGRGERLRPLTDTLPKPLVTVGGRPIIDRALDRLVDAGVERVVVNVHHHAPALIAHLDAWDGPLEIAISHEETPLETGGGVRHALPLLGSDPVLVINGDAIWLDGPRKALWRLADRWEPETMDALLLTMLTPRVIGYCGRGDWRLQPDGQVSRRREWEIAAYVYASVQIIKPALFRDGPTGAFSTNLIWDHLIEAERLFAVVHDGAWFHVNAPDELAEIDPLLEERNARWLEI